jgi:hypothetical protein
MGRPTTPVQKPRIHFRRRLSFAGQTDYHPGGRPANRVVRDALPVPHRLFRPPTFTAGFRPLSQAILKETCGSQPVLGKAIMGKKLYVGNLGYNVTSSDLQALFTPHGSVQSAQVIEDRDAGRSKGFGFVEMSSDEEARNAIAALNGTMHGERALTVNEAKPRENRSPGGYGRR